MNRMEYGMQDGSKPILSILIFMRERSSWIITVYGVAEGRLAKGF